MTLTVMVCRSVEKGGKAEEPKGIVSNKAEYQ
jgi:hypothetical protein